MFAIGLYLSNNDRIYVTDRVTDPSHYIIVLLFMLCEFSSDDLTEILPKDGVIVDYADDDFDEANNRSECKIPSSSSKPNEAPLGKSKTPNLLNKRGYSKRSCGGFDTIDDTHDNLQSDLRDLLAWDARVNCGFKSPCVDDIDFHDAQIENRRVLFTLILKFTLHHFLHL